MKKYVYILFAATLVSCAKEQVIKETSSISADNKIVLYAQMEQTKVGESVGVFSWKIGEKVAFASIENSHKGPYTFECTNVSGKFEGTYDGSDVSKIVMAVSPSTACTGFSSTTNYNIILPTAYEYSEDETNVVLIGENADKSYFMFHPVTALIKATFEHVPAGVRAAKLTTTENITGTVKLTSRLNGSTKTGIVVGQDGLNGNTVQVKFAENELAEGDNVTVYFPVPYGNLSGLSVCLQTIESENYVDINETSRTLNKVVALGRTDVFSLPAITLSYTVGNTDFSSVFGNNTISSHYAIAPGQVLHFSFINHGQKEALYQNWALELWGSKGSNPWTHYLSIRPDNWDNSLWSDGYGSNCVRSRKVEWLVDNTNDETITWSDETYLNIMDGATVSLDIEYTGHNLVLISATGENNTLKKSAKMTYYQVIDASSVGNLMADLRCDHSYFDIKKVWRTGSASTAGITSDETFFIYDKNLSLATLGLSNDVSAVMTNGTILSMDNSLLSLETAVISGSSATGRQPITGVVYDGKATTVTLNIVKGTSDVGVAGPVYTDDVYESAWRIFHVTNAKPETQTFYLYAYSDCNDNFSLPQVNLDDNTGNHWCWVREDNYVAFGGSGWETKNSAYNDGGAGLANKKNDNVDRWDVFRANQNKAKVTVEVTNNGNNKVTVRFRINAQNGKSYWQNYYNIPFDSDKLQYKLVSHHGYTVLIDSEYALANGWTTVNMTDE